jgi:hypothetical protein
MPKKKGKKKTTRRRRVGALSLTASNPLVKFGPIALGYLMADTLNTPIYEAVGDKVDPKLIAAAQTGLGAFLAFGGKASVIKSVAGGFLLGSGAKKLMAEMGVGSVGGYGAIPVIGRRVNGYGSIPVIGKRMGAYSPNGSLGAYSPNGSLSNVMAGVMPGSGTGSGMNSASGYM